jgi:uncharacterized YigZ family protein
MDEYRTVSIQAQEEFVERKSRFIGHIRPVATQQEAQEFLNGLRAKYWDASHNVYAYSLREGQLRRYSDDGEPQGTAGVPVLEVLQKSGVTDAMIVVTRYFGGTLLGAGGLVRAYSHAASLALAAGGVVTMRLCGRFRLHCEYAHYGRVQSLLPELGGVVDDVAFTQEVEIRFHLPGELLPKLEKALADATCGRAVLREDGEFFTAYSHPGSIGN